MRFEVAVVWIWIKPAMASVCPSLNSTTVRALRSSIPGTRTAVDCRPLGEIQLADDRFDVKADHVVGKDLGDEVQDRAEAGELDGDNGRAPRNRRALRNRIGEIAAHQETRGLAVQGNQVRFSQDLGQAFARRALMNREKCPELKTPKSWPPLDAVPVALNVEVTGERKPIGLDAPVL